MSKIEMFHMRIVNLLHSQKKSKEQYKISYILNDFAAKKMGLLQDLYLVMLDISLK